MPQSMRQPPFQQLERVSRYHEPCPRRALAQRVQTSRESYAALSRMLGRADGYLGRFVNDGHPTALSPGDHRTLAEFFGVEERGLGVRDLWRR